LREIPVSWILRVSNRRSEAIDDFIVWLLENTNRFSPENFRTDGLHDAVLHLLDSPSKAARDFAISYARVHARDLAVSILVRLVNSEDPAVRDLAIGFLRERDPRTGVGLEAFGNLLGTKYGDGLAREILAKSFGARELTPAWFRERLFNQNSFPFASEHIFRVHKAGALGVKYFYDLFDDPRLTKQVALLAVSSLLAFPTIDQSYLRRFLIHTYVSKAIQRAVKEGNIEPRAFGIDFLKRIVFRPDREVDPWIVQQKKTERGRIGLGDDEELITFPSSLLTTVLEWLRDPGKFQAVELGRDWLMRLVRSSEPDMREFATQYLISQFSPGDFVTEPGPQGEKSLRGCLLLFQWLTAPGKEDDAVRLFSIEYVRNHHRAIRRSLGVGELPADTEIPSDFFNFENVRPLMFHTYANIRSLALEIGRYEAGRWKLSVTDLLEFCECPHIPIRDFIAKAMLSDDTKENQAYRIDPALFARSDIYALCESTGEFARNLGMRLIRRNPGLADPDALFRLTESPDRRLRVFVIHFIWTLYRDRGITRTWIAKRPVESDPSPAKKTKSKKSGDDDAVRLSSFERPPGLPASHEDLNLFLRRILFEIPPSAPPAKARRIRTLSARKAKLAAIEVFRDIATGEKDFASIVYPLLDEFKLSQGRSEHAACLVALERLNEAWPDLARKDRKDGAGA